MINNFPFNCINIYLVYVEGITPSFLKVACLACYKNVNLISILNFVYILRANRHYVIIG